MSSDEQNGAALTPVHRAGLSNAAAKSLAVRGRAHLRDKEEAEEWLRKGLELQKAAPPSHWSPGPINPYAAPQPALSAELQRIKEQEEREQLRKRDEMLKEAFRCFESGLELDPINPKPPHRLAHSYHPRIRKFVENEKKLDDIFQQAADLGDAGAQIEIGDADNQCGFSVAKG